MNIECCWKAEGPSQSLVLAVAHYSPDVASRGAGELIRFERQIEPLVPPSGDVSGGAVASGQREYYSSAETF